MKRNREIGCGLSELDKLSDVSELSLLSVEETDAAVEAYFRVDDYLSLANVPDYFEFDNIMFQLDKEDSSVRENSDENACECVNQVTKTFHTNNPNHVLPVVSEEINIQQMSNEFHTKNPDRVFSAKMSKDKDIDVQRFINEFRAKNPGCGGVSVSNNEVSQGSVMHMLSKVFPQGVLSLEPTPQQKVRALQDLRDQAYFQQQLPVDVGAIIKNFQQQKKNSGFFAGSAEKRANPPTVANSAEYPQETKRRRL